MTAKDIVKLLKKLEKQYAKEAAKLLSKSPTEMFGDEAKIALYGRTMGYRDCVREILEKVQK